MDIGFKAMKALREDYGSQYEILVAALYAAVLKPDSNAIDGGANAGLHAIPMASLIGGGGHLYCFEPIPRVFLQLAQNLVSAGVIHQASLHVQALSSQAGTVEFLVDDANTALSHIRHEETSSLRSLQVPTVTLDAMVGPGRIDFIKLDLEGADFLALQGARAILQQSRPLIVFENSRGWAAKCYGYSSDDFFRLFDDVEYALFDLHGRDLTPSEWDSDEYAFEFVAGPKEAAETHRARKIISQFWETILDRDVVSEWTECVRIVRSIHSYLPWLSSGTGGIG
jgi:FkbM family methyltransferase